MANGYVAYVGSRSTAARKASGIGITVWTAPPMAQWAPLQTIVADDGEGRPHEVPANPTYLLVSDDRRTLYVAYGDSRQVGWLDIDQDSGLLSPGGLIDVGHANPVDLLQVGSWLIVSFLAVPGEIMVLPIQPDASLGAAVDSFTPEGILGPHAERQKGANPHQTVLDPSGHWLLVCDRAHDTVWILDFDQGTGKLRLHGQFRTKRAEGPRHIAFHPDGRVAYVITELRSDIYVCRWNADAGRLSGIQVLPSYPDDALFDSCASEICASADGRWVFASNRSGISDDFPPATPEPDTIGVFAVQPDGTLRPDHWVSTQGHRPRYFVADPAEQSILVANEISGTICSLPRSDNGLDEGTLVATAASPTCIAWGQTAESRSGLIQ